MHDSGPAEHLTSSADRQVVRRASSAQEVTLTKGHHDAQLLCAAAHETPFGPVVAHLVHVQTPLAVLQLQPRAKRAAHGVTRSPARSRSGRVAHGVGQSPSEEALSGRRRNRTHGRHPPCRCTSHRASLQSRGCPATGIRDVFLPSLMRGRGSRAAAPRNDRKPSLCLFDPVPGIVPQKELAAKADVSPLRACCS